MELNRIHKRITAELYKELSPLIADGYDENGEVLKPYTVEYQMKELKCKIMKTKFKEGDRVQIKGIEWWKEEKNSCRSFYVESFNNYRFIFTETMLKFLGKRATITKINDNGYNINIDGYGLSEYVWGEEILEPIEKEHDEKWEKVRIQASIAAMKGLLSNPNNSSAGDWTAKKSVEIADKLIEELKNKQS